MAWFMISDADGSILDGPLDQQPTQIPVGSSPLRIPINYPDDMTYVPALRAFIDVRPTGVLITVGRFKLLMTQPERIALRAAALTNPLVEDFLDLLNGFTDGVSLGDPEMVTAIGQLQAAGLFTADRAAAILSGTTPE